MVWLRPRDENRPTTTHVGYIRWQCRFRGPRAGIYILCQFLALSPSDLPLFRRANDAPFSQAWLLSGLRLLLTAVGLQASAFAGHSFRIGAASDAAEAGFSDYKIQILGRWRSDAYRLYIRMPISRILSLTTILASHNMARHAT